MKDENKILIRIAALVISLGFLYFFCITFLKIPEGNKESMNLIISFINSSITLIIGFYYGSTNSKKNNIDLETKSATISKEDDLILTNTKGSEITTQESQETNP